MITRHAAASLRARSIACLPVRKLSPRPGIPNVCGACAMRCLLGTTHVRMLSTSFSALGSSAAGLEGSLSPTYSSGGTRPRGRGKNAKALRPIAGILSIKSTWNNTLVTISDTDYKVKGQVSAGSAGFKKSKRSSFFATEKVLLEAFAKAREFGMRRVMLNMTGPAVVVRKPLLKQLREQSKLRIMKLRMSDSVPHGGCRPRKSRRRRYKTKARR
eukprot:CAMPEP_0119401102 /NCGR_PEP_ID=MMETSP1334-20130426/142200_1 /TAXON_ID=127549 /ORGANISM="Calcidiscus leptoporus, Strain RCC1130" /LENGTH=214 /DNA_ID=CAMNT_0007425011 /DNA_START=8 /DNA_END=652 /DNA_ORIENTATION=-